MSWYRSYYLGKIEDGKIFPLGLYDNNRNIYPVFTKSRSFASELYEDFSEIPDDMISDSLRKDFPEYSSDKELRQYFEYLEAEKLGSAEFTKRGYFLISDIEEYQKTGDSEDLFYDYIDENLYGLRLANELKFGEPKPVKDEFGEEYTPHACKDYAYFAYNDYNSREYEVALLKNAIETYEHESREGLDYKRNSAIHYVIILTEG